jgi:hypothetical protein
MILWKPVAPKRTDFAKWYRIRDIEPLGIFCCPYPRPRWLAGINPWPSVHRNGLQAGHSCFELLLKGFIVDAGIDLCGVEMLMSKGWYVSYLSFWPTQFSLSYL